MLEGDEMPDWCPSMVVCIGDGRGVGVRRRDEAVVAQRPAR